MDERSGSARRATGPFHGLAVRPAETPGLWYQVTALPRGCLGLAIGHQVSGTPQQPAAVVDEALRGGGDPVEALGALQQLGALDEPACSALCAVIDRPASRVSVSSVGDIAAVVSGPGIGHRMLRCPPGELTAADLSPGDTLLLCTAAPAATGVLLDECTAAHPCDALDRIVDAVTPAAGAVVAVLYRHPPASLQMSLPAEPSNLATMRDQLRQWLAIAGVDAEDSADALLAVGEAASNSAEHSVAGVAHEVTLSVEAWVGDGGLRFTVADNGRWQPARDFSDHRGLGIKLINALVDTVDLTTGETGTTVRMLKEMRQ